MSESRPLGCDAYQIVSRKKARSSSSHPETIGYRCAPATVRSVAGLQIERGRSGQTEIGRRVERAHPSEKVRGSNPLSSTEPAGQRRCPSSSTRPAGRRLRAVGTALVVHARPDELLADHRSHCRRRWIRRSSRCRQTNRPADLREVAWPLQQHPASRAVSAHAHVQVLPTAAYRDGASAGGRLAVSGGDGRVAFGVHCHDLLTDSVLDVGLPGEWFAGI
jgi:hypothetical protein